MAPPRPTRRSAWTSKCSMPPSSAASCVDRGRGRGRGPRGCTRIVTRSRSIEPAQRAAHGVDDALGLAAIARADACSAMRRRELHGARARPGRRARVALGGERTRGRRSASAPRAQLRPAASRGRRRSPRRAPARGSPRPRRGPGATMSSGDGAAATPAVGYGSTATAAARARRGRTVRSSEHLVLVAATAAQDDDLAGLLEASHDARRSCPGPPRRRARRCGGWNSMSSRSISAPRWDMLRRILSLTPRRRRAGRGRGPSGRPRAGSAGSRGRRA